MRGSEEEKEDAMKEREWERRKKDGDGQRED